MSKNKSELAPASAYAASGTEDGMTRLVRICAAANLGGLLSGMHLALFSGILEMPNFATQLAGTSTVSALSKSLITTMLIVAFTLTAPLCGGLVDRVGRRPALQLTAVLFGLSALLTILPLSLLQLLLARMLAGAAYAFCNVVCPMYTAEVAPTSMRGSLVNLYQLSITVGIVMAQTANWYFAATTWLMPVLLALAAATTMLVLVWFVVPESPVWLASRRSTAPVPSDAELGEDSGSDGEREKSNPEPAAAISVVVLLRDPAARRRLLIGGGLVAAQQWSGINGVIFFGPAIVGDALNWEGSDDSLKAAALVGACNVAATVAAMSFVDRMGRRRLLLTGGATMVVSLVALAAIRSGVVSRQPILAIGALMTYIIGFATTFGPVPFVVCSEIFPMRYKGVAMSFCSTVLGASSVAVAMSFLPLLQAVGGGVYLIYATLVLGSMVFVWHVLPETKGLSLQQIDDLL